MALQQQLHVLESSGLIKLAQSLPELEYIFRHALAQESAYTSLLRQDRRDLHRKVGTILEHVFSDRLEELAAVLAYHFEQGADAGRALDYFTLAGDRAFSAYANAEAALHYASALNIAQRDAEPERLLHLYLRRGRALELLSRFDAALLHYEEMEKIAHAKNDLRLALASLTARATIHTTVNFAHNPIRAQKLLEQARELALALGDRETEVKLLWNLMLLNTTTGGPIAERTAYGEQALALARELDLREQLAFVLTDLWYIYAGAGDWERSLQVLNESCDLWRELDNKTMLAESSGRIYLAHLARGEYAQALQSFEQMRQLAESSNSRDMQALCRFMIGFVHMEHGEYSRAVRIMEEAIELAEPVGNVTVLIGTRSLLAWCYGLMGWLDHGIQLAQRAQDTAQAAFMGMYPWPVATLLHLHLCKGDSASAQMLSPELGDYRLPQQALRFIAFMWIRVALTEVEYALANGDLMHASNLIDSLLHDLHADGVRCMLPDTLLLKARVLIAQHEHSSAFDALSQAQVEAEALGSQRTLWEILALMSDIDEQRGNADRAGTARDRAKQIVQSIAAHIDRAELRDAFLDTPHVRKLLRV